MEGMRYFYQAALDSAVNRVRLQLRSRVKKASNRSFLRLIRHVYYHVTSVTPLIHPA